MNNKILKEVMRNRAYFTPFIFTDKQIKIIRKYLEDQDLSNAEKKSLYTNKR